MLEKEQNRKWIREICLHYLAARSVYGAQTVEDAIRSMQGLDFTRCIEDDENHTQYMGTKLFHSFFLDGETPINQALACIGIEKRHDRIVFVLFAYQVIAACPAIDEYAGSGIDLLLDVLIRQAEQPLQNLLAQYRACSPFVTPAKTVRVLLVADVPIYEWEANTLEEYLTARTPVEVCGLVTGKQQAVEYIGEPALDIVVIVERQNKKENYHIEEFLRQYHPQIKSVLYCNLSDWMLDQFERSGIGYAYSKRQGRSLYHFAIYLEGIKNGIS